MDPVINSLVQSPLVRSMSTVPSKASSFVHGVRDNVPPFSFQKVVVQPWNNPSKTSQDQSHKFRIPQFGTLNRAYLRINMNNQVPTAANTSLDNADYAAVFDKTGTETAKVAGDTAEYDTVKGKFRIPWAHNVQIEGQALTDATPFGAGGASVVEYQSLIDPEDGNTLPANSELRRYASHNALVDPSEKAGSMSNAWNVCNILDEIRLTTNGKLIETVYGETIPAEVVKMPAGLREFYQKGMVGYKNGGKDGSRQDPPLYSALWDPTACHRDMFGRYTTASLLLSPDYSEVVLENQHASFIVPVTLSSLKTLSKNYQTRFVEDLELEVKTKDIGRGFNEFTSGVDTSKYHQVELVLIYHNWHDNIENTIRNSNYKRGVPASVYSTNWVRAATTAKVVSDTLPLSIPLTSRNLTTELVVVARAKSLPQSVFPVEALRRRKSDYTIPLGSDFQYSIELTGSGKTIWSSTNKELQGPDSADYDLTDRRIAGGDSAYGGMEGHKAHDATRGSNKLGLLVDHRGATAEHRLSGSNVTQCGVDVSFSDNMAIMRFGFQTTDEFYSGGIALQTISNPTIKITPPTMLSYTWTDIELEFDVYVKHANLVRIDSDTGAVSRTLDV